MFRPDGLNRSIRIATVVPHADAGPDAELQAMDTDEITIHGSRLYFSVMLFDDEMGEVVDVDTAAIEAELEPRHTTRHQTTA